MAEIEECLDILMELVIFAPIVVALPALIALLLSVCGVISVPRWTWVGFIGFSLLAFAPFSSLVGYLVTAPLPWSRPKYSGLVVAPVAFVLAIILVKRGARITARRRAVVVWTARAGGTALGLVLTVVWLVHLVEYKATPATREPHYPTLGDIRMDREQTDKAIAARPDDPALRLKRASERAALGDRQGAMDDLERYRALTHNALGYHISRARLLSGNFRDCTAAIAEYDAAQPLAPTMAAVHGERAQCYEFLGRTAAAIDGYSAAIQHDPQNGNWWLKRGELFLRLNQRAQGCSDILHGQTLPSTTYAGDLSGC
jgi:hypothetical protein